MTWVFAAFAAVWIAVFMFLVHVNNAQRSLDNEITALKSQKR